ncbi:hypothetical protein B9G55_01325 [Saccharibacillus sp. O16]|nr:hypothetical protein B9G55_01325 [Saccharibacillus sp. O16]
MPDSFPFPMFSGILEPGHYKKIGNALWLFAWCINSTTSEQEKEGTVWGLVFDGKPVKASELQECFDVTDRTVRTWIKTLEQHDYIRVTRAPYGMIILVRNSKRGLKRSERNFRSLDDRPEENFRSLPPDRKETSDLLPERPEENFRSNKDLDLKDTITTTTDEKADSENEDAAHTEDDDPFITLLNAYCTLHGKFDIHVNPREREAMGKMVAGGMPVPFTIRTMEILYEEKRQREGGRFQKPSTFLYYVPGIEEAWRNQLLVDPVAPPKDAGQPRQPQRKISRQQDKLDDLQRRREEARKRGAR